MKKHEWKRIGRFVSECIYCEALRMMSSDREGYEYTQPNNGEILDSEPECIERPEQEAGNDESTVN